MAEKHCSSIDRGYAWFLLIIAWLVVAIATSASMTYGVYYNAWLEHFPKASSNRQVSAIAALHVGGFSTSGAAAGWLFRRFGFRPVIVCSLALSALSYALLGLCAGRSFAVWYALSIMAGVGNGVASVGALGLVGHYFERRRHLAAFLLMCAPCTGIILLAPFHNFLAETYGVEGAMLVLGALVVQLLPLAMLIREPDGRESEEERCADGASARDTDGTRLRALPAFWLYALASILAGGYIIMPTFAVRFATSERAMSEAEAAMLLSYGGVGILSGRAFLVIFEALGGSRRVMGHLAMHHVSSLAVGTGMIVWPMCGDEKWAITAGIVALSFAWGIKFGLLPGLLMDSLGPKNLASAWGFSNFVATFSLVLCPIGAGWLADRTGTLTFAFYLAGPLVAASTLPVAVAQYLAYRERSRGLNSVPSGTECELLQVNR